MADEKRYTAEIGEFKGSPVIQIWEVDKKGKKVKETPVMAFGKAKANALASVLKEVEKLTKKINKTKKEK